MSIFYYTHCPWAVFGERDRDHGGLRMSADRPDLTGLTLLWISDQWCP